MKYSIYSKLSVGICSAFLITVASSCMEDAYNPNANKNELPPIDQVFGFETRGDVKLTIDYNAPGFQAYFQIFDKDPIAVPGTVKLKEGIKPIYTAFTTEDSKFDGVMNIPTSTKDIWLYTDRWGLSSCKKLTITASSVAYDAQAAKSKMTRISSSGSDIAGWFEGNGPYDLTSFGLKYSINPGRIYAGVKWTTNGDIKGVNPASDVFMTEKINDQTIADVSKRAQNYLETLPMGAKRAELIIKDPKIANITTKEDATKLNMVFLHEQGLYSNALGYYYYKTTNPISNTNATYFQEDFNAIKKYVVFPHAAINNGPLSCGSTVALKFYGEKGDQPGTYDFPKNYVIGFFLVPNGFVTGANDPMPQYALIDGIRPNDPRMNIWGLMHSSNELKTASTDFRRFISLYDEKSKSMVIGIEDELGDKEPDGDYCDVTFIVASDKDINGGQPVIPEVPEKPGSDEISGTLVFEDTWPKGGDYDLNDVAVEYKRTFTFGGDNKVTKLVEEFTFIQEDNAANNTNYFAYQVENDGVFKGGQNDTGYETESKSFMIKENSAISKGKTYTFTRTFSGEIKKDDLLKDFNPYIIVTKNGTSFSDGQKNGRIEVHLPKYKPTDLANKDLIAAGEDAYYTDAKTRFPFAIDITTVADKKFTLCPEKKNISTIYSRFASWAGSMGKDDTDWYTDAPKSGN